MRAVLLILTPALRMKLTYLFTFLEIGQHNDDHHVILPHHFPEIPHSVTSGTWRQKSHMFHTFRYDPSAYDKVGQEGMDISCLLSVGLS